MARHVGGEPITSHVGFSFRDEYLTIGQVKDTVRSRHPCVITLIWKIPTQILHDLDIEADIRNLFQYDVILPVYEIPLQR